jgi:3-isopropylmalate dehydratase
MPSADIKPRTLYDKVFQDHIVDEREDGTILLYIGMVAGFLFEASS